MYLYCYGKKIVLFISKKNFYFQGASHEGDERGLHAVEGERVVPEAGGNSRRTLSLKSSSQEKKKELSTSLKSSSEEVEKIILAVNGKLNYLCVIFLI